MSNDHRTGRNHVVNVARVRHTAGAMADKRQPRGGARNEQTEMLEMLREDQEIRIELSGNDSDATLAAYRDQLDRRAEWSEPMTLGELIRARG
jgi:hypothetical protein